MITCLSRTLDDADYAQLADELRYVDHQGIAGQHPARRWEYALALHAIGRWVATGRTPIWVYNAGGGSSFSAMLDDWLPHPPLEVAPAFIERCVAGTPLANVVLLLAALEHAVHPEQLLYGASTLLTPGGLLVLTMAFWNRCGEDTALYHERRQRIYCPKLVSALRQQAEALGLTPFGGVDPTWHGTQVHDHTLTSLVLQKRERW
jgi:hypothetical protein